MARQAQGATTMSDSRTTSILQRVPVILAVTAASYGLTLVARNDTVQAQQPQKTHASTSAPKDLRR
jgi:hypothetical protein